jgi:multiple antibiotic resistance protein
MSPELFSLFTAAFVTFFVLIDAPGVAPIFATLTARGSDAYKRKMAIKSVFVATLIMLFFAFGGAWLLDAMHISIDAFRAAGGVLLFMIALDMVFEKRTERREHRAEEVLEEHRDDPQPEDISVFPMGIPMIAGPGSIATAMFYMSEAATWAHQAVVLAAIGVNLLITLVVFLMAGTIVRLIGASVAGALTRILGVILAALSAQLIIDGVRGAFGIG